MNLKIISLLFYFLLIALVPSSGFAGFGENRVNILKRSNDIFIARLAADIEKDYEALYEYKPNDPFWKKTWKKATSKIELKKRDRYSQSDRGFEEFRMIYDTSEQEQMKSEATALCERAGYTHLGDFDFYFTHHITAKNNGLILYQGNEYVQDSLKSDGKIPNAIFRSIYCFGSKLFDGANKIIDDANQAMDDATKSCDCFPDSSSCVIM